MGTEQFQINGLEISRRLGRLGTLGQQVHTLIPTMYSLVPRPQEKRPGNSRKFKLLHVLPLPESWQYQSNFRTQSHDNSKTQLCNALNCRSYAYFTSIAIARSCQCRRFAQQFLFEQLLFHFSSRTDSKQLLPRAGKHHSHSWKNCKYHVHQTVGMHIAIAVTSHPYTV